MEFRRIVTLKGGRSYCLRNRTAADGQAALANFKLTHEQTDFLLSYPDESDKTPEQEAQFLQDMADSVNGIELLAEVGGAVVGMVGISAVGTREKVRHRAKFGVTVDTFGVDYPQPEKL